MTYHPKLGFFNKLIRPVFQVLLYELQPTWLRRHPVYSLNYIVVSNKHGVLCTVHARHTKTIIRIIQICNFVVLNLVPMAVLVICNFLTYKTVRR